MSSPPFVLVKAKLNQTKVFILVLEGDSRNLSGKLVTGDAWSMYGCRWRDIMCVWCTLQTFALAPWHDFFSSTFKKLPDTSSLPPGLCLVELFLVHWDNIWTWRISLLREHRVPLLSLQGCCLPGMVSVRWVDSILSCICQPLSPTSLHVGSTEALSWYCRVHNAAVLILPAAVTEKRVGAGPGACTELLPTPSSPGTFVFSLEAAGWSWIFKGQACLSTLWWMRELCLGPFLGGQHWTWAVAESQLHNQVP